MLDNSGGHKKIKTLFFAANPEKTSQLMIDEEIRAILTKIRAAEYRDSIELVPALAARPDDLIQALNEHSPRIVHFSAHGKPTGEIILLDQFGHPKPVTPKAIQALFETLGDNIRVVILNACYSKLQARAIIKVIDCAIGIGHLISNRSAITFAASFYSAIGFGRSVKEAFEQGRTALLLEGVPEERTPELLVKKNVDPAGIFLLEAAPPPGVIHKEAEEIKEGKPGPESLRLMEKGMEDLELQDYEAAFKNFQKARELEPQDEKIQFLYCLSFLSGKPLHSINEAEMNGITIVLKKIAQGKKPGTANLARMVLGILWFDYYTKVDHRYQELFFKENTRYLGNYQPRPEEKELVGHIRCSDNAKTLARMR